MELILCSVLTIVPDYLYRRYVQGKRLGACLSIRRISLYTEGRVRFCLAHEQDLSPLEDR